MFTIMQQKTHEITRRASLNFGICLSQDEQEGCEMLQPTKNCAVTFSRPGSL